MQENPSDCSGNKPDTVTPLKLNIRMEQHKFVKVKIGGERVGIDSAECFGY